MYGQGAQVFSIQKIVQQDSYNCSEFFQKYFVHKNWRGGGELLLIKCAIDSYAYKSC